MGIFTHPELCKILFVRSLGDALDGVSLEQEACVDVEGSLTVLLVEAACVLERHDEVLVHDEAQTCA